jgi:hypothetical protein
MYIEETELEFTVSTTQPLYFLVSDIGYSPLLEGFTGDKALYGVSYKGAIIHDYFVNVEGKVGFLHIKNCVISQSIKKLVDCEIY